MESAKAGHTEVVRLLLDRGANPGIVDDKGKTALDYAKKPEIKRILESAEHHPD